jgi:uncharacterized alkaline shock family protein YloU
MDEASAKTRALAGSTTIAANVLVTIAQLTALGVPGVARLAASPGGLNRLMRRGSGEGVIVGVDDGCVSVELHLVLCRDVIIREVSRKVQTEVARAIHEMVGMEVGRIDVQVEDIDYGAAGPEVDS